MAGKVCKCCVSNRDADDIQRQRKQRRPTEQGTGGHMDF
jgi:predicted amino acid dehydrogenase